MTIRLEYQHGTDVSVLRACANPAASDLIAIGGEHSVEVVQIGKTSCRQIATFYIGARVTALAWSSRTTSPAQVDAWRIELAAAGDDLNLRLLTKDADDEEGSIFVFGGGLSGHRRKVNDLAFSGGFGADSFRYIASVSDDKILLVWDLDPEELNADADADTDTDAPAPSASSASSATPRTTPAPLPSPAPSSRPQPIAFGVPYAHPLHSVAAHAASAKGLIVSDAQGSVFVLDWRGEPPECVAQLVDPRALADARTGMQTVWGGAAAWQPQDVNVIGATYGARWAIWDMRRLQGGKPLATGAGFAHGSHRFRWSPTDPQTFALSALSPLDDAALHIHNTAYPQSAPRRLVLRPRPHRVRDFDWLAGPGGMVAAVGASVLVVDVDGEAE